MQVSLTYHVFILALRKFRQIKFVCPPQWQSGEIAHKRRKYSASVTDREEAGGHLQGHGLARACHQVTWPACLFVLSLKQRKYALFRTVGHISVDPEGFISSIDTDAEALFQVNAVRQDFMSFEFDRHRSEAENALEALWRDCSLDYNCPLKRSST